MYSTSDKKVSSRVKQIIIDRLTDDEIVKISNCVVDRQYNNTLIETSSPHDRHMGIYDRGKICETCSCDWEKCIGGVGVINLPIPYHSSLNDKIICQTINSVCKSCLRFDKQICNITKISNKCSFCVCDSSNTYNIILKKIEDKSDKNNWDVEYFDQQNKEYIKVNVIKNIIENAVQLLNEKNTKNEGKILKTLINNNFIVTPTFTRPCVTRFGQSFINERTSVYNAIIKESKKNNISKRDLFDKIEMLLTQKKGKALPNSSKIPKSIQDTIQGKDGLINANINGKRVNNSARSTITGYPSGILGEVGVPECMTDKMTIFIPICSILDSKYRNFSDPSLIQRIYNWILKEKPIRLKKDNGQTFIFTPKTTQNIIKHIELTDMIERNVRDGDIVLFNRNPSIRPESIIAKKIRIIKSTKSRQSLGAVTKICRTLRLTLPCTTPLNADFDGDECNLHVLQDHRATIECFELMNPAEQLISSQKGIPIITPVQDALIGVFLLSLYSVTSEEMNDILLETNLYNSLDNKLIAWNKINKYQLNRKNKRFPGFFILSMLFDSYFQYIFCEDNTKFEIKDGIIIETSTPLTKRILCSGVKSIIHFYYFSIGKWATCNLEDNIQKVTNYFLVRQGFTISLEDCNTQYILNDMIKTQKCLDLKDFLYQIDPNIILGEIEMLLMKKSEEFNNNNFFKTILSGAKGSMTNFVQVTQLVGLQSIDGTNVKKVMKSNRTLPYFDPSDDSLPSIGLVSVSFFVGLNKAENIFHAKAGKHGIKDSVIKVSESGYTSKKICKFLENLVVEYDLTVRHNENKKIIQFLFGSDGMNPQRLPSENIIDKTNTIGKKVYLSINDLELSYILSDNLEKTISRLSLVLSNIKLGLNKYCENIENLMKNILNNTYDLLSKRNKFINNNEEFNIEKSAVILRSILEQRIFQPGSAVGLISGSNFGEITSQLLLKSFHHSGIKSKDISSGIKRMNQLLNRTTAINTDEIICGMRINENIYNIYKEAFKKSKQSFSKEFFKTIMENRSEYLVKTCQNILFKDIIEVSIFKKCDCLDIDCSFFKNKCGNFNNLSILYIIKMNYLNDFVEYFNKIQLDGITLKLNNQYFQVFLKNEENNDILTKWNILDNLTKINKTLLQLQISNGIIKSFSIIFNENINDFEIITKGIKLSQCLNIPFIDISNIYSCDSYENQEVFGIESARESLMIEIKKVLDFDGADIDNRHLELICDMMCYSGKQTAISNTVGILTNALFEKEIKKLNTYSLKRSIDPCTSIESSVFLGKECRVGTGFFECLNK